LGIGYWGLGIGDWAQSPIPNPQSPIPNPQSPYMEFKIVLEIDYKINNNFYIKFFKFDEYISKIVI